MEFGLLLRLVGVMNLILILSCPFDIEGRELYLHDFVKKTTNKQKKNPNNSNNNNKIPIVLACIQTYTDRFLSNLV